MRSYDEYCAIAKSLDVVGDRWTLLIVRELAQRGACRYTDLRYGLPGIATNLLADRLRELEQAGVIAREEAPPPVATTLYRLTPRGKQLTPVLEELTRWGLPLMTEENPRDAVRSHWLAGAIEMLLTDRRPDAKPITVELRIGDQPIVLETRGGAIHTRLGPTNVADMTLTGPPRAVLGLLLGMLDRADAKANGVSFEGDTGLLERLGVREEQLTAPLAE
jgi:DNA-binding HxlR family transcriptional regulator